MELEDKTCCCTVQTRQQSSWMQKQQGTQIGTTSMAVLFNVPTAFTLITSCQTLRTATPAVLRSQYNSVV